MIAPVERNVSTIGNATGGGWVRTLAISGLGSIGRQHVQAAMRIDDLDIVVYDRENRTRDSVCAAGGRVRPVDSFDALLGAGPTALVIATPDESHLDQLARSTAVGIIALVEKPVAPTSADVATALPQLLATGTPVVVGYVLRHRPVLQRVRELLHSGAIGTPTGFQVLLGAYETLTVAVSRFAEPARNRLYRDYSHEWDYLRWLFGPLRSILATSRTVPLVEQVEHPNIVDGLIRTDDVVGAYHIDYVESPGSRTITVIGTEGRVFADLSTGVVRIRSTMTRDVVEEHPMSASDALKSQLDHVLAVAAGQCEPAVTLVDGFAALAAADAAIASAAEGNWVDIATVDEPPRL